jgi:hypothetical protein
MSQSNNNTLPTNSDLYKKAKSVLRGFAKGIDGIVHTIAHPLNSVVYPISSLVYDAAVISAKHTPGCPETDILRSIIHAAPHLYDESVTRMENRGRGMKEQFHQFNNASSNEKIEGIAQLATEFLVPGAVIKSVKHLANYHRFGTWQPPPKYHNTVPGDIVHPLPEIKLYQIDDIRKLSAKKLAYVYTDSLELLIAEQAYGKRLLRGPDHILSYSIKHPELAKLKPVYAAGEITVENGIITSINNASGHYAPHNINATMIEKAFIDSGYVEAAGTYAARAVNPKRMRHPKVSTEKIPYPIVPLKDLSEKEEETITNIHIDNCGMPYVQCSQLFDLELEDLEDMYGVNSEDISELTYQTKLSHSEYKADMSNRILLSKWSNNMCDIATISQSVSQIALLCGGHKRTWNNISKVCSGITSISARLSVISMGGSMLSMASGYIGISLAAVSILSTIFGDDDEEENGFQQLSEQLHQMMESIMSALQTIHQTIIDGFQCIEGLILHSVVPRLIEINAKLDRLETITCLSFRELHAKSLVDIIDTLTKDLLGESILSTERRNKQIDKLGTWIDCHSRSLIQTSLLRVGNDDGKAVDVFRNFTDPYDTFSFFLVEMSRIVQPIEAALPNIPYYMIAVETYISAALKYKVNSHVLHRAKTTWENIQSIISELGREEYSNTLRRQYRHYKFRAGRQIDKCRLEYTDDSHPLRSYLKMNADYEILQTYLDSMELRRVLLSNLQTMLRVPVDVLESKEDILNTKGCMSMVANVHQDVKTMTTVEELERVLDIGMSVNLYKEGWGQLIHYILYFHRNSMNNIPTKLLHAILRCPEIEYNKGTTKDLCDTYYYPIRPILYAMNQGRFECGVLLCAQGHNINDWDPGYFPTSDMGNIYKYSNGMWGKSMIGYMSVSIMKTMNDSTSKIYRDKLRLAYTYYKKVEAGLPCSDIVDGYCLMLLTCIIGDTYPMRYSKLVIDVNEPITSRGMTYLMMACYLNNVEVIQYLLELGADINLETDMGDVGAKDARGFCLLRNNQSALSALEGNVVVPNNPLIQCDQFQPIIHRIDGVLAMPPKANKHLDTLVRYLTVMSKCVPEDDRKEIDIHLKLLVDNPYSNDIVANLETIDTLFAISNIDTSSRIDKFIRNNL